jgi:hypothetical protein
MTEALQTPSLQTRLDAYAESLVPELDLLRALIGCSSDQNHAAATGDLPALARATLERQRVMDEFLALETAVRPMRDSIAQTLAAARALPGFWNVNEVHREAERLFAALRDKDAETAASLRQLDDVGRSDAQRLEAGELTLAAYKRVVAPPPSSAELVDRRG